MLKKQASGTVLAAGERRRGRRHRDRPRTGPRAWLLLWTLAGGSLAASLGAQPRQATPVWPLDARPLLTSSFGEFRATHLHAGIDLATGGRVGLKCFAVGDGHVARLRMSPFGYGKAIYVQLDSGPLVVYAHLSRFSAKIAARAEEEQRRRKAYTFDVYLKPDEIRVSGGEVIARSGDTGVGFPHLHFEVRDGDVARNPQTAGFALPDAVAPEIRAVSVIPLDTRSRVQGHAETWIVPAQQARPDAEPIVVSGRVGFAVRCIDRAAKNSYRQAPYRYELRIDGKVAYQATHERFDYAHNHHILLEYDLDRLVHRGQRFFHLFAKPGNALAGRDAPGLDGGTVAAAERGSTASLAPGRHIVEIELADVEGNVSGVRFPVWASAPPVIEELAVRQTGEGEVVVCRAVDPDRSWFVDGQAVVGELPDTTLTLWLRASDDAGATWDTLTTQQGGDVWHRAVFSQAGRAAAPSLLHATVRDASGLTAHATWARPQSFSLAQAQPEPLGLETNWDNDRLRLLVHAAMPTTAPPEIYLHSQGRQIRIPATAIEQTGVTNYRFVRSISQLGHSLDALQVNVEYVDGRSEERRLEVAARIVHPGDNVWIDDLHDKCSIEIEARTLFAPGVVRIRDFDAHKLPLGRELKPAGACVAVENRATAFNKRPRLRLASRAHATGQKTGLFYVDRDGKLRFLSSERDADGALVGKARYWTVFAELEDVAPPVLRRFRKVGPASRLQFQVRDEGAGLGDGAIAVEIDGIFAIPEWDPENGRVIVHPFRDLPRGTHVMNVAVEDRVGNRTSKTWTFEYP